MSIVPSNILKNILINRYALNPDNSFPISGFVAIGMQEGMRGNGWYNNNADIAWKEIETADIQYKQMIKENIYNFKNNIPHAVKFYIKKIASMWTDPMQESIWQNLSFNFYEIYLKDKSPEEINYYQKVDNMLINNQKWAKIYQKALLFIIFGLSILVIIKNRANISNEIILLLLCFMGGLFFHILWEAKSRYIIPYIIILIPIACIKFNTKLTDNENSEKDISSYTNVL